MHMSTVQLFYYVLLFYYGALCSLSQEHSLNEESIPIPKIDASDSCAGDSCHVIMLSAYENGRSGDGDGKEIMLSATDCKAAEQTGLSSILCPLVNQDIDCHIYSRTGQPIRLCKELQSGDSIWYVPNDRLFIWPTFSLGTKMNVTRMPSPVPGQQIVVETLSTEPKVFRLYNFFSEAEAEQLIHNALTAQGEEFRLKRSSTGATGYHVDNLRTSENAFDIDSTTAMAIKRRAFELLGIYPYDETLADGLQILRYNLTTAYVDHMDWIEPVFGSKHNWDSKTATGTNRFATILLYFSDVEDGGETIFTNKFIGEHEQEVANTPQLESEEEAVAYQYLIEKNISELFPERSWQRKMVAKCRSPRRLSLKPKKAEAVLFYSQLPDGSPDRLSLHGGCPVLDGVKWAANLWIWNGPRQPYWTPSRFRRHLEYLDRPRHEKNIKNGDEDSMRGIEAEVGGNGDMFAMLGGPRRGQRHAHGQRTHKPQPQVSIPASFTSIDVTGAQLFWENQFWADLTPGEYVRVNTYARHRWNVRVNGEVRVNWIIADSTDGSSQDFVLRMSDIV